MDANVLKLVGQVAGIGGLGLGVILLIYKDLIRKAIFPNLSKAQGYALLRLVVILTWIAGLAGIAAWTYVATQENPGKVPHQSVPAAVGEDPPNSGFHEPTEYEERLNKADPDLTPYLNGRSRLELNALRKSLLRVAVDAIPAGAPPQYVYKNAGVRINLDKLNRSSGSGLTLQQYIINTKVSCFESIDPKDESALWVYLAMASIPIVFPAWNQTDSADCQDKSGSNGAVLDVTIANAADKATLLTALELLVTESDIVGGDIAAIPGPRPIPVTARYVVPITYGGEEAWLYPLTPPLAIPVGGMARFQLQFVPEPYCGELVEEFTDAEGSCTWVSSYAIFRTRFLFGEGEALASPQIQLIF